MKKQAIWIILLSVLLLFAACDTNTDTTKPTDFRVACFECGQQFSSGQINTDFGLCHDCMIKTGASYCKNCAAPCYTIDMVQGLCKKCSASTNDMTTSQDTIEPPEPIEPPEISEPPETTAPSVTITPPEPPVDPKPVHCDSCRYSVLPDYMIGNQCIGCYAIREWKCLRCTYNTHLTDGCHCEHCSSNWFYCTQCDKRTAGSEMFLNLCMDCYWKLNSVLVPCPLCGASYSPSEITSGFCRNCYAQVSYDENDEQEYYRCASCDRE